MLVKRGGSPPAHSVPFGTEGVYIVPHSRVQLMRFEEMQRGWLEATSWTFRFPPLHTHSHPDPHPLNLAQRVLIRDIIRELKGGKEGEGLYIQ